MSSLDDVVEHSKNNKKQTCTAKCCVLRVGLHIQSKNSKTI